MKTTIKPTIPAATCYELSELENETELQALFNHAASTLRPCDKCGATTAVINHYYVPTDEAPHHFRICCVGEYGCAIQTPSDSAFDNEQSIKDALNYVCTMWNRNRNNMFPPLPFPYQPPEASETKRQSPSVKEGVD